MQLTQIVHARRVPELYKFQNAGAQALWEYASYFLGSLYLWHRYPLYSMVKPSELHTSLSIASKNV